MKGYEGKVFELTKNIERECCTSRAFNILSNAGVDS